MGTVTKYHEIQKLVGAKAVQVLKDLEADVVALAPTRRTDRTTPDSTSTYLGGHPYVPAGEEFTWPLSTTSGQPLVFLLQVDFGELPTHLADFPTNGMLQWFADSGAPSWGSADEANELQVRWLAREDLGTARHPADAPLPYGDHSGAHHPLEDLRPLPLTFTADRRLPFVTEANEHEISGPRGILLDAYGEIADELEGKHGRDLDDLLAMMPGMQVGGTPVYWQADPRGFDPGRPSDLILNLDSIEGVMEWGDMGTAQLFGDLSAIARGDLSSCWWTWSC